MDKPEPKPVKRQSNYGVLAKQNERNKKNRNSMSFRTLAPKKRGVYVENDYTEDTTPQKELTKAPRRPSRGQKPLVSSVLTLLSKSPTATQHLDSDNTTPTAKKKNIKDYKALKEKEASQTVEKEKKKKKYRSRVLNGNKNFLDNFKVLQPKKAFIQTPSLMNTDNYDTEDDDATNIKWSDFLPRLVKPDAEEIQLENDKKLKHLVKVVTEGRATKEKKVKIKEEEPSIPTLVSEKKQDPALYNFFVDLMETTFNVYTGNNDCEPLPDLATPMSSKIRFEIDEAVASKLNPENLNKPVLRHQLNDDRVWNDGKFYDSQFAPSSELTRTRYNSPLRTTRDSTTRIGRESPTKMRRDSPTKARRNSPPPARNKRFETSFAYKKHKNVLPLSQSVVNTQPKSYYKKNCKKNLLNLLKQQLKMNFCPFEEPQNLYQALKVMARNKRKTQKAIRFDNSVKVTDVCNRECTFKRRRVFSPRSKSKTKNDGENRPKTRSMSPKTSELGHARRFAKSEATTEDDVSNHSLEVYNIDYDSPRITGRNQRQLIMSYRPPPGSEDSVIEQLLKTVQAICQPKKEFINN